MAYRMVFSDMDGTLLKSTSELSEKNIEIIGKAVDKGVEFVICTGRGVYGVERFLEKLNLIGRPGYVICQNGAAVYNLENMEMVLKHSFSSDDLRPVVEIAREEGVEVYLYDDRTFVAEKGRTSHCRQTQSVLFRSPVSRVCENWCQQRQCPAGNGGKSRCASEGSHCHWGQ